MANTNDVSVENHNSPKAHLMLGTGRLVPAPLQCMSQFYRTNDAIFSHLSASSKRLLYAALFSFVSPLQSFCKTLVAFQENYHKTAALDCCKHVISNSVYTKISL